MKRIDSLALVPNHAPSGAIPMANAPRTEHEPFIARWQDDDVDEADELHAHFTALEEAGEFVAWFDVASESRRLWKVMFNEDIEEHSAVDSILNAVAASGYGVAVRHVAQRLGVSTRDVMRALDIDDSKPDAAITAQPEKFFAECKARTDAGGST
jgi:hypothetical protein